MPSVQFTNILRMITIYTSYRKVCDVVGSTSWIYAARLTSHLNLLSQVLVHKRPDGKHFYWHAPLVCTCINFWFCIPINSFIHILDCCSHQLSRALERRPTTINPKIAPFRVNLESGWILRLIEIQFHRCADSYVVRCEKYLQYRFKMWIHTV